MVEKTDIKPETYGISFARYQGPLSTIEKEQELPSASIRQYTSIYHPGHSYVKSRRLLPLSSFGKKEDLASGASSDEEEKGDEIKKSSKHPTENTKASGSRAEKVGKFPFWRPGAHKSKDRDEGVDSVRKMEFAVERITDDSTSVPKVYILDQTEEMRSCPSSYCNVEIIRKEDVKPETYKIDYSAYQGPLESIKHADELPSTPIRDFSSVYHPGKYEFSETRPVIEGELKEVPSAHTQEEKSEKAQIAGGSSFISSLTGRKPWQPEDQQKSYGEAPVPSSTVSNDLVCTLPPSKEMNTEPFVESKKPDTSAHIHEVERSPGCNNYGDHLDNLSSQKELPAASLPQHASTYHPQFSHAENKDMKEIDGSSKVNEKSGGRFSFWKGRKLNGSDKEKEAAPCGPYSAEKIDRAQTLQESSFGPSNTIQNDKQAPEKSDDALGCQALGREIHVGEDEITEQADVKPETHSIYFCPDPVGKIDRDDELPTTAIGDFCSVYHPGEIVVEGGGGENRREAVKSEKDSRPARPEQSSGDRDSKRRPLESEAKEVKDSDKSARSEVLPSALHGPVDEISRTEEIASVPYHASAPAESPLGGVPTEGTSVYTFRRVTDYDSRTDSSDEYPSVIGRRIELSSIKSDLSTSRAARSANAPHTSTLFGRSNLAGVDPLTTVEGFTERMPSFYTLQTYVSDPYGSVKSGAGRSEKHGEEESRSDAGYLLNDSRVGAAADSREAVIAAVGESGVSELSPSSAMDETPRTLVGFIKRRITQSITKSSEKRETKKKIEKKKAKNAMDGGGSTSSSDTESKEREHRPALVCAKGDVGEPEQLLSPSKDVPMCENLIQSIGQTDESRQQERWILNESTNTTNNHTSTLIAETKALSLRQCYHYTFPMRDLKKSTFSINTGVGKGTGTIMKPYNRHVIALVIGEHNSEMWNLRTPHVKGVERNVVVKQHGPLPHIVESSAPHTTVESWHESTVGPESVVTDVDMHGNVIKKTFRTQQVKHTIQRQTYQTYSVTEGGEPGVQTVEASQQMITPIGEGVVASATTPIIETRSHTVAYEAGQEPFGSENGLQRADIPGELISCRTITSGNRTVETITYKTEKDGIVEIHVEHRVTIHSGANIDHDAELSQAILEATNMNPDMTVEKIEVKQESQC
ncbi:Protein 4.1 -like protein [Toxocara canis]|uniref:Protein 4.1-like protein n=1 Tax=Toxocara canis TaxID=6265 RepID=A0A0B2VZV6_TOXCA|nr:Protein 4.1 -like protein [Toxocara canis]